jgi:hypothetical protein
LLIFFRRIRADYYQMLGLMVGVLVMTAILAGAPMYLGTIESLGLRATLANLSVDHRNIQVVVDQLPLTDRSVSAATERVEDALDEFGDLVVGIGEESHTRGHHWATDAESIGVSAKPDIAVLQRFEGFEHEVLFIEGRAPKSTIQQEETHLVAEVVVPAERAAELEIAVGDEVWLTPNPLDLPYLMVRVVGLFEVENVEAEFWLGLVKEVVAPGRPAPGARFQLPLFFTRDGLFGAVTGGPASIGTNRWLVKLDAEKLERQSPALTASQADSVGHELRRELPESKTITTLENPLRSLGQKISYARIPTLMMGGVLLLTAGYYSIMAAGALIERRRVDTARMWARGSGQRQVALQSLIESSLLVFLPAIIAPFLGFGVIHLIGLMPEYESISLGSGMPVYLMWQAFAWSLAGAFVVFGYIQWIVWKGGGRAIGAEQASNRRVEGKPFFQRQYLDLLFFVFGGVVLWDLSTETSVATESGEQVVTVNPLLVFAPAIFMAVAVMLSLRVLPPMASLISSGLARGGPAWGHMISALFARVPLTYAWPAAILGMAAGTTMLSATVASTLQQGSVEQSGYEVGADLRIFPVDLNSGDRTAILDRVRAIDGVRGVSGGLRTVGSVRAGGEGAPFEFLAIESREFGEIGVFRDDYAESDSAALISLLGGRAEIEPLEIPEFADRIGYRVRTNLIARNITASIRLVDANGLSHQVGLGSLTSRDWQVRMGRIPSVAVRPVEIVGLTFFELTPDELGTPISIQLDDLMYEVSEDSSLTVIESFDGGVASWSPLASSEGVDTLTSGFEYLRLADGRFRPHRGLQINLGIGTDRGIRGTVRSASRAVPILFSKSALVTNNLSVGDETVMRAFDRSIPVRIVGVTELFPTLSPDAGGFGVMDVEQLWDHLKLSSANSAGVAAEMFVGLDEADEVGVITDVSSTIGGLHSVMSRKELHRSTMVTPLAIAGWRGASVVTATLAVVLAVLGFLTFALVRPAGDNLNLAVLRSLGARKSGLVVMSFVEQLVVLSVGVAAGIGMGLFMARFAVDTASQTDSNINTLPPIVFSTNWNYVGALVVSLAVLAIVILIYDIVAVRRIDVAETVRTSGKSG